MINIKEISWINFLGYSDYTSKISFNDIEGVCFIEGEFDENGSRDEGDEKLNGAGKSSIIEAITWGLFGSSTRNLSPGDSVINWHTGKNCKVNIKTHDGYEIVRMRKYNGLTETLLFKDGDDITQSTSVPIQKLISDIFKINYNTFIRSRIFGQFTVGFLEETEPKRRKVFEHAMHIDNLDPIVKVTKDKIEGVDKEIAELDTKIDGTDGELSHITSHIESLKDKSSNFSSEIDSEIEEIKVGLSDDVTVLKSKITKAEQIIDNKKNESRDKIDVVKLQAEWDDYNAKLEEHNKHCEKMSRINQKIIELESDRRNKDEAIRNYTNTEFIDVKQCEENESNHSTAVKKRDKNVELRDKLNLAVERIKTKMQQEEEFINHDHEADGSKCSKCRNEISGEQLEKEISESKNLVATYEGNIKEAELKLDNLKSTISTLNHIYHRRFISVEEAKENNILAEKNLESFKKMKEESVKLGVNIGKLSSAVTTKEGPVKPTVSISEANTSNGYVQNIDDNIADEKQRITDAQKEITEAASKAQKTIKAAKLKTDPYVDLIKDQNNLTKDLEENKQDFIKTRNEKKTIKDHLSYIRESYRNKRKIKAFWINELIPDFNKYLKYYLDFFEINDKIEFDELLALKMNRWGYNTHSGGECKRIDLSIMFALSDLQVANFGTQSNFMILDEVDGRVDPFTMNKLTSLLLDDFLNRNDGLTNIFVISHRKEMKDRFPHKIKVKNKQERSYIESYG